MVKITVDTNAGEDGVYEALLSLEEFEVRRQRLDVGDAFVHTADDESFAEGICVERKTWADLAASIVDGRLAEQKSRMIDPAVQYVYAIEDQTVASWDGFFRGGAMRNKCLWGSIVKMQLRDHCSVVHTCSPADTAALVHYLAQQLRDGGFEPKVGSVISGGGVHKRKRDNLNDPTAALRAMLAVIPGMSASKAGAVVGAFPTAAQLVSADETTLSKLSVGQRKLGPKMATAIKTVFS